MIDRTTKLRWRRRIRQSKKQVEDISLQAEQDLDKHLFRRLNRLTSVRRFVFTWILLLLLLIGVVIYQTRALESTYLSLQPAPGGTYNEGVIGSFTNANPLYAVSDVDSTVSKLIFSGLFKYDQNNQLVGDLANSWQVDPQGITYTVQLKHNLMWQDGKPLTAADVVFTYQLIQNPDTASPLANSWQNITVTAPDPYTVVFKLPSALTAFPYSLTNGIVPEHLLSGIPTTEMRSIAFDTNDPIGSGPFRWKGIDIEGQNTNNAIEHIGLTANENYFGGTPKLNGFIVNAFPSEDQLLSSFQKGQLNAADGFSSLPDQLNNKLNFNVYNIPLTGEVMAFFRNSNPILTDVKVRQALVMATNTSQIINGLGFPVIVANEPLLKGQLGYSPNLAQLSYNINAAKQLLNQAGWVVGPGGIRTKNGKRLTFSIYSQSDSEYAYVTQLLQQQWRAVGVDAQVFLQPSTVLQTTISSHSYDALVYGITIGNDPDVFDYWDSSQADIRSGSWLNFSEYQSAVADQALEAGRSRADATIRTINYGNFLTAWRNDAPAVALYQPQFLYVTKGQVYNFNPKVLNTSTDRLDNVQNWEILQVKNLK